MWSIENGCVAGTWKLEQVKNVVTVFFFFLMASYPVKGINFRESDFGLHFMYHYI